MNLEQALEITLEYCWRARPAYLKKGHSLEEYMLTGRLITIISESFNRLASTWGEDNIVPKDIHLLIETLVLARYESGYNDFFNHRVLIRK